jgi:hypothetical protein
MAIFLKTEFQSQPLSRARARPNGTKFIRKVIHLLLFSGTLHPASPRAEQHRDVHIAVIPAGAWLPCSHPHEEDILAPLGTHRPLG